MNQVMTYLNLQNFYLKKQKMQSWIMCYIAPIELGPVIRTEKPIKSAKVSLWDLPHSDTGLYSIGQEKKLKSGFKVKLDLTKSRFNLLQKANVHVKEIPAISFCYADVNCRFRVKFHKDKQEDIFFSTFDELRDIVDSEI